MGKTFSLLCPTRSRDVERDRLLMSLRNNTSNKDEIEILFAIDRDDHHTQEKLEETKTVFPDLNIKVFVRNRSVFINRDYYNWLAGFAEGDFYWVIGDDLVFAFNGWDVYIKNRIEDYLKDKHDRIACIGARDNTPPPGTLPSFPCFPMVTKEAAKALGFVLHPNIPTWGADYVLYCLYKEVPRLLVIDEHIFLNHISYHTRKVEADAINKRVGEIFNSLKMIPMYNTNRTVKEEVPQQVNFLKNYIEKRFKYQELE